jgi:hypothetical protein
MKRREYLVAVLCSVVLFASPPAGAQTGTNCFLQDYYPKYAVVPPYQDKPALTSVPAVTINVYGLDTLGVVSNYVFGNAVAVWVSTDVNNPTVVNYLQMLSPTLIRYPGGSWSDVFFWNGDPGDLPDSIYDATNYYGTGTVKTRFYPQFGPYVHPTPDSYYNLRAQLGIQGLITINYAYARYSLSPNPVQQAAHYAADWVRYDNGRTAFWEIGNESGSPWEFGFLIDTTTNQDGQPAIITGELYGRHFRVFADSMRAAAAEVGATIYIGGQIVHYDATNDWIIPNRTWNEEFFREVGDAADFYVMHNYFGSNATNLRNTVENGRTEILTNIAFIRQDIVNKGAADRPIAVTEWNVKPNSQPTNVTSVANGMQAVTLFCEMLNNNFGMSARWLIANWDADGMFYYKSPPDAGIPLWNPRPDFYYIYYLQRVMGDHVLNASVSGGSYVHAYATRFTSGHTGLVVVNSGPSTYTLNVNPQNIGVGDRFYVYTLTGIDNTAWPQSVVVNGHLPSGAAWGPLDSLLTIPAAAYPIGDTIRFSSPPRSVEYILLDDGNRILSSVSADNGYAIRGFRLDQNYPNPFNPTTAVSYQLSAVSDVKLAVYDLLGREVAVLVNERKAPGQYEVQFDATRLASGMYFCSMTAGAFHETRKLILMK